jgi:cell division protease FtsH
MNNLRRYRPGFIWIGLLVALSLIWFVFARGVDQKDPTTITRVIQEAKEGKISRITQVEDSRKINVQYRDSDRKDGESRLPPDSNIFELLQDAGVDLEGTSLQVEIKQASRWGNIFGILGFLLPTLFLIGIFVFMMRQAQGSNSQAMAFGKSRARLFSSNRPTVTFSDVAGVE